MSEITIHIHEDDWGMRNLYPIAALSEASSDVRQAAEEGERNRAPDGVGWTEMHVIKESSTDYAVLDLRLADAVSVLEPIMPRVRRFTATAAAGFDPGVRDPLGSYEQDAYCFGFGASCFLKLETEGDLVRLIWFECRTQVVEHLAALRAAIAAIDAVIPSAIADYWNDMAGSIGDRDFLDRYFESLRE